MTCCTYPRPHEHYSQWLRRFGSQERCRCGQHIRLLSTNDLLQAWKAGR